MQNLETKENLIGVLEEYNETRPLASRNLICHAPSVSLNFNQDGMISACCYNRTHVLGEYPKDNLGNVWKSAKAKELRQAIKDLDLTKGCALCRVQIIGKSFFSTLARNFDNTLVNGDLAAESGPRILEFELSNLCNLECIMCNGHFSSAIRKNREKLPPIISPYDEKFVQQLRPFWTTVEWARFLGGEPFLNPLYFKIWEQIVEVKSSAAVAITSNGTIMNKKVEWVLENVKPFMILSIDSLDKKTYESIRVNASYEQMKENLFQFISYAQVQNRSVDIMICPLVSNWEEIPQIFDWGFDHEVCVGVNTVIKPEELSLRSLSSKVLMEIAAKFKAHKLKSVITTESTFSGRQKAISALHQQRFDSLIALIQFWGQSNAVNEFDRSGVLNG